MPPGNSTLAAMERDRRSLSSILPDGASGKIDDLCIEVTAPSVGARPVATALVEIPYTTAQELLPQGREYAELFLRCYRVLAALCVEPEFRGLGIATGLLRLGEVSALREGARWLVGFADERTASSGFYQRSGYTLTGVGQPITWLPPVPVDFPGQPLGRWFFKDLWEAHADQVQCDECSSPMVFDPTRFSHGALQCPRCGD